MKNRVTLAESDTELAVAIKLVSPPGRQPQARVSQIPARRLSAARDRDGSAAASARVERRGGFARAPCSRGLAAGVVLPAQRVPTRAAARRSASIVWRGGARRDAAEGAARAGRCGRHAATSSAAAPIWNADRGDVDRMVETPRAAQVHGNAGRRDTGVLDSLTSSPVSTDPAGRWAAARVRRCIPCTNCRAAVSGVSHLHCDRSG